jgi:TolA-binding protein
MTDDLLARATRALREESGDDASARLTRARVMGSLNEGRVRHRTRVAFLIPIAATFAAATVFGAAGGRAERAFDAVARVFGVHRSAPVPKAPRSTSNRAAGASTQAPARTEEPVAPPLPEVVRAPPPETTPSPVAVAATSSPVTTTAAGERLRSPASGAAGAATHDPAFELYRSAHRAHFQGHDSARALEAWNAYLRAAPNGSFAMEARYNRGLCLVRLERAAEARSALEPFARGRFGGYRQAEAQKLIDALGN